MSIWQRFRRARGREEPAEAPVGERVDRRAGDSSDQGGGTGTEGGRASYARGERRPRRSVWGPRAVGAAAVGTVGWGVLGIARLVMTVAALIALLIALAIVLRDVDANSRNSIVKSIHEGANFFAGAFTGLVTFNGHPKREITVDWGIALVAYLVVG